MSIRKYYEYKVGDVVRKFRGKTQYIVVARTGYRAHWTARYEVEHSVSGRREWIIEHEVILDNSFEAFVLSTRWKHNRRRLNGKQKGRTKA